MKKVLLLVTKSNWGGAQRYIYDVATHLPTSEYEPVVACGPAQGSGSAGPLVERLAQAGIRTVLVPELTREIESSEFASFRSVLSLIRTEAPDVLHLSSSKAGILGALAGRLARTRRIVFTVHGWPFREPRNPIWCLVAWLGSMLTVLLAHRVICVSASDYADVPRFLRDKAETVRNALPAGMAVLERDAARDQLITQGVPKTFRTSVWLGIIAEHTANKDIATALRAFAQTQATAGHASRLLVLIGSGEESEHLKTLALKLGISDSVYFAGFVENASQYLRAFDATLLTSQKEGLPYAILESFGAGVPVIASSVGGIPELVTTTKNGILCRAGDSACFAQAIESLATLPPLTPPTAVAFDQMIEKTVVQYR